LKAWEVVTPNIGRLNGDTVWAFEGPEIFKRAVLGMAGACADVLEAQHVTPEQVALVVPHQANLRIIEAVAKRAGVRWSECSSTCSATGTCPAATVPVALVEALEEGRIQPNSLVLLPAFGPG
jgi:3-oxoacyl-[acyl-carrier-protein] synthase-3